MPLDPPIGPDDHVTGPDDAVVHLVHYGDFECPYSKDVYDIVTEIRERHPDRVRLAFRHFPVRSHPHALAAAVAAEAAGRQGAFWPFHDRLYAHQLQLRPDQLVGHAEALGLDGAAVRAALDDEGGAAPVLAQKRAGVRSGVRSTLGLWIDNVWYEEDALEDALVDRVIRPLQEAEA
ncbi:thioredoxin domain-containing protein [Rubrivirga sp. S365]|uniref:Thioredoxin domain-containing protein n=1 Tax=Rubrivirga litoralis TaxID=3075598 RepID=A0ABU3BVD9_9BACT|nr:MULTISPECIES: thioredoxin domain-containing protein [unclassified Rubrivirga]MDT0633247.1 thioredoxin domain-containing protein [Rubrivirga sp. F394]MDT7857895.1 thioredoxin domain-containing protein [Rubrivirga sp. S365]